MANKGQKDISRLKEEVHFYKQVMNYTDSSTFECPTDYKTLLKRPKFDIFPECTDSCSLESLCRIAYKDAYHFFQESQQEL